MYGWAGQRLRVDLSSGKITKEPLSYEYRRKWIGGRGFNSDIIYNEVPPNMDPFDPNARVCFGVGGDSLNRFSYMIYSTGYSYVRVSERYEGYADVIPTRPPTQPAFPNAFQGDEYLINQGKIDVLLSEVSVGFGYSKKIADNVGIGFSLIGVYRDQTKIRYESYPAYDTINQRNATSDLYVDIDYWAVRFSGKFGISAEWDDLKLGATITTPSLAIKLASGGTDYASINSNNVLVDTTTGDNAELFYPILKGEKAVRASVFFDAGQIYINGKEPPDLPLELVQQRREVDVQGFRYSAGVGVAWNSPLGPLKFSYAWPLNDKVLDKIQRFHVPGGHRALTVSRRVT